MSYQGKLLITDLQGRHVSAEAEMTGPYDLVITTTGLLPGIYLITLQTAGADQQCPNDH